uniref:Uncharacterized protein n=1 Tax=Lepeophtheirus salmonis TaxID=72036 RepID=A0A0K2V0V5_LEPSM
MSMPPSMYGTSDAHRAPFYFLSSFFCPLISTDSSVSPLDPSVCHSLK